MLSGVAESKLKNCHFFYVGFILRQALPLKQQKRLKYMSSQLCNSHGKTIPLYNRQGKSSRKSSHWPGSIHAPKLRVNPTKNSGKGRSRERKSMLQPELRCHAGRVTRCHLLQLPLPTFIPLFKCFPFWNVALFPRLTDRLPSIFTCPGNLPWPHTSSSFELTVCQWSIHFILF